MMGLNGTSTLVCHFLLSPRAREKSDIRDNSCGHGAQG